MFDFSYFGRIWKGRVMGNEPFFGKRSWLTTMLCVSISYDASSWTSRSVSYNDKNSEMHTQMNVVFSCSQMIIVSETEIHRLSGREDSKVFFVRGENGYAQDL